MMYELRVKETVYFLEKICNENNYSNVNEINYLEDKKEYVVKLDIKDINTVHKQLKTRILADIDINQKKFDKIKNEITKESLYVKNKINILEKTLKKLEDSITNKYYLLVINTASKEINEKELIIIKNTDKMFVFGEKDCMSSKDFSVLKKHLCLIKTQRKDTLVTKDTIVAKNMFISVVYAKNKKKKVFNEVRDFLHDISDTLLQQQKNISNITDIIKEMNF